MHVNIKTAEAPNVKSVLRVYAQARRVSKSEPASAAGNNATIAKNERFLQTTANALRPQMSISSLNFFRSTLPPETMQAIGPSPAWPVSAAASGNAPAPSEITRAFSAISFMAWRS